jgi:hypothetical protein
MLNEFPNVEALVDGVKGTTGFLSTLISRKSGLIFMLIVLGAIVTKLITG